MAIIYTVNSSGAYVAYGLSTDTKPTAPADNSLFIEADTDNSYLAVGGAWTLPTKHKTVRSLSDFPTPVSSVITLEDNTLYLISGTVDLGTNRIVCGIKNTLRGSDKQNDILISSTTGAMITLDSSGTDKGALFLSTGAFRCPSGTIFNIPFSR